MLWDLADVRDELAAVRRKTREGRKERSEGIYFIRPGSRTLQQQSQWGVAEVGPFVTPSQSFL